MALDDPLNRQFTCRRGEGAETNAQWGVCECEKQQFEVLKISRQRERPENLAEIRGAVLELALSSAP